MLSSIFYQLLLQPLETIYGVVFDFCQHLCSGRILPSLLLLSIISSLILTAVESKASKYVNKEKLIQGVLAKQLTQIKAQYKGAERQERIKALYRRYSYNPLFSVRSSLGVLSQLPFLLGAYLMLLHDESLRGIAIGKISDISASDGLLWGLNLLPFVMLSVNALNTWLSTWLTCKEKLTSLVIGLVFFILLYAAPSCMLIYWTTNNAIQLIKTAWKRLSRSRKGIATTEFIKSGVLRIASQISPELDLPKQLKQLGHLFLSHPATLSLLALAILTSSWLSMRYAERMTKYCQLTPQNALDPNCSESLMVHLFSKHWFVQLFSYGFTAALLFLLFVLLIGPTSRFLKDGVRKYGLKAFYLRAGIGVIVAFSLVVYLLRHASSMHSVHGRIGLLLTFATLIATQWDRKKELFQKIKPDEVTLNKSKSLFLLAILFISGFIAVYAPTMLFLSDPQALELTFTDFTVQNLQFLLVIWFSAALCYYIATNRIRIIISAGSVVLAILAIIYGFILIPNLGTIQSFKFDRPEILNAHVFKNQDFALALSTILIVYLIYRFNKLRQIGAVLLAFCAYIYIFPIVQYQKDSNRINELTKEFNRSLLPPGTIPENVREFFTFSKKDNILVIAMDAFTGGNIRELIKKHPDLKDDLAGFTWFEDTLTAGQPTFRGIQGCLGGEASDPVLFQNDDELSSNSWERIDASWAKFLNYLSSKNYDINIHEPIWLQSGVLDKYLVKNTQHRYLTGYGWDRGFWNQNSQLEIYSKLLNRNVDGAIFSYSPEFIRWYGFYSILPNSLKHKIYQNGVWKNSIEAANLYIMVKTLEYSNSELLPYISSVSENLRPQYKFIHLGTTHSGFNMDDDCNITSRWFHERNPDNTIRGHLNTEFCSLKSLGRFFRWMKTQGVYDNTQIILVSDHGEHLHHEKGADDSRLIKNGIGLEGASKLFPNHNASYALLMVKERRSGNEYQVNSNYLMRNLDTTLLVKHALGDELNYEPYKNLNRVRINLQGDWSPGANVYSNSGAFVVRGSMFNKANWTTVTDPEEIKKLGSLIYGEK